MGIQLLNNIQIIHEAGYAYNDLKLDNCCAPRGFIASSSLQDVHLVDFGLAKKFVDENGVHLDEQESENFEGNLLFSSFYCQDLRTTSRRDDLISLCYLLIYSLEGSLPWMETDPDLSDLEEFHTVKQLKQNSTAESLCNTPDSSHLKAFVAEILKLQFKERPDYQMLGHLLQNQLIILNKT